MATATEGKYAGEFLVDDEGELSREAITVLSGQVLKAGHVVGRVNRGVGGPSIPAVSGTGNGTMTLLFAGPDVESGSYVVKCTTAVANGGVFSVTTPSGVALPALTLTVGAGATTAYTSRHINFSITDGSTDFAANDTFTIVVAAGTSAPVIGTGNGTLTGVSLGPDAFTGAYLVRCIATITNGGTFEVVNPIGEVSNVGSITAGAGGTLVRTGRQLNFTITDGSTDFVAGDVFNVFAFNIVSAKAVEWDARPAAFDGRQIVAGISWDNYDATAADVAGVLEVRRAQVNGAELTWKSTLSAAEIAAGKAALTALGVVVR